ncbi:hypothetical protein [Curtobacterium sp. Leaf261]|uniref:hypothetical protein n=1 Tax=Curtobacterium sp. Leaf261 TaxID=1736311 RepID=UPI000714AD93|nr:hypothetical protein [Curtobacterium sp. Leaf261]KQO61326.1 hypothetical protein ASF23_12615 [Curtobacterium sp. Leaf261]
MATVTKLGYAPRTRAGLMISCTGFAVLAASTSVRVVADVITPVMGVGFVLAVLFIVYLPRTIRPGRTWLRAELPHALTTLAFVGAAVVALTAVAVGALTNTTLWGCAATAVIVSGMLLVVLVAPDRNRIASR